MKQVSVIIPLVNEAESVRLLHQQLASVSTRLPAKWEFVFVDDGSEDGTWEALQALRAEDPRVRLIRFRRNFGQTAAMACGIDAARGEILVTMDGDLQNDPADIPRLMDKLEGGYDVVCGWRYRREDAFWSRRLPSFVANRLIGWLTGVRLHDYGCSLKAYRAAAIKRTPLYAEFHRFIPALSTLTGALVGELKVAHHPRRFGQTNYTLWRAWKVTFDMVTVSLLVKFASKPLRFFGVMGLVSLALAVAAFAQSWSWYVGPYRYIPQILPGVGALCVWLAGHLFIVGLIGELCLVRAHAKPDQLIATNGC